MKRLGELSEIRTGYPFRGSIERVASGGCALVQMGDIRSDSAIIEQGLVHVKAPPNWNKHVLQHGDVLFVGRGVRNDAAIFTSNSHDVIAAPHLLILHANEREILPEFLVWLLNLPATQECIRAARRGSGVPFVPVQGLLDLEVDLPGLEAQKQIASIWCLSLQERRLLEQISNKRRVLIEGLLQKAARRRRKH